MAKTPDISKRNTGKPSKLLTAFALVIVFSLPYYLVKNFSHHKKPEYTQRTLTLPKLPEKEIIEKPQDIVTVEPKVMPKIEAKAPPKVAVVRDNVWQTIKPHQGDTMGAIFKRLGLSAQNLHAVLDKNPHAKTLTNLKLNQEIKFLINKNTLEKLVIPINTIQTLTVYRVGNKYSNKIDSKKMISKDLYITATVKGSLFTTAQKLSIPSKLIRQMTEILNKEIDFRKGVRAGDQFSIVYNAFYINDKMVQIGDIQAVSYTTRGKTAQAVRHNKANGDYDYYTPQGRSFKKAFSRYPIKFSHISSTFALSRNHPILHYKRAHKGIDLAAPIGTPIQATGDGVIQIIDRHNGYGNMIKIKHDGTYSSIYGHMLKFQKGLSKGSRVKRGQVIGYVGQTGLATGPHCHYELHVNNQPRNPTTIALPTASPISGRELASFKARAGTLLARLKSIEKVNQASPGKKNIEVG
ncbi:peptidoglycan DD-metalloendopeptidase family protein [Legionella worsleiensis]|uniref:M23/M37 family transporter peptidase n=1 Tax=Legionella worsleiensis TaxID=45076 RepID=A0A0W1AFE4_9GAMM|nr:peptidoglycan DD-metalloendopeptidase family protein [Legionella worsleiensis]KTD80069.1 M23/M37 family transporter peptidase [Legionella worsleiensis]STY32542.1 peptidase, M23/M37 family [Legionella worsleiensis]